jgi:glutathione S-transferase
MYPKVEAVPSGMRDEVLHLRDTAAGRFALRLYAQERA